MEFLFTTIIYNKLLQIYTVFDLLLLLLILFMTFQKNMPVSMNLSPGIPTTDLGSLNHYSSLFRAIPRNCVKK